MTGDKWVSLIYSLRHGSLNEGVLWLETTISLRSQHLVQDTTVYISPSAPLLSSHLSPPETSHRSTLPNLQPSVSLPWGTTGSNSKLNKILFRFYCLLTWTYKKTQTNETFTSWIASLWPCYRKHYYNKKECHTNRTSSPSLPSTPDPNFSGSDPQKPADPNFLNGVIQWRCINLKKKKKNNIWFKCV